MYRDPIIRDAIVAIGKTVAKAYETIPKTGIVIDGVETENGIIVIDKGVDPSYRTIIALILSSLDEHERALFLRTTVTERDVIEVAKILREEKINIPPELVIPIAKIAKVTMLSVAMKRDNTQFLSYAAAS